MHSRFVTNLALLGLAELALVACFAFALPVVSWIALGAGCAASVLALVGFALRLRGRGQRVLDVLTALAGGWLIVASRTFALATVKWIAFGDAGLLAALAAIGLVAHELARARAAALARRLALAGEPPVPAAERWRAREAGFDPQPITAGRGS